MLQYKIADGKQQSSKAMWDAGQDNIFIDICLEEVVARNIGFGRCLNTVGFSNLEAKFNARKTRTIVACI